MFLECFSRCLNSDEEMRSMKIDQELKRQRRTLRQQVRILLLGSGESGKSTFLKQMVIIHGRGEFTNDEVAQYKQIIYQNCINSMRVLIQAKENFCLKWERANSAEYANHILKIPNSSNNIDVNTFTFLSNFIDNLWQDSCIQTTYDRRNEFQLVDSCKYFFENIRRISQVDYFPTNRDILMSRKATRSITEHLFHIQNIPFLFVDVGGQRSQRQKWFQCFDGIVTAILFLFASNEYDQVILEDKKTNRVVESIALFETIVNNKFFSNIALILFLNKTDLLIEKLPKSDFTNYFPDFTGDRFDAKQVQLFLLNKFDSVRKNRHRCFFFHSTTAIDTENIRTVFNDCKKVILEQNLRSLLMQ